MTTRGSRVLVCLAGSTTIRGYGHPGLRFDIRAVAAPPVHIRHSAHHDARTLRLPQTSQQVSRPMQSFSGQSSCRNTGVASLCALHDQRDDGKGPTACRTFTWRLQQCQPFMAAQNSSKDSWRSPLVSRESISS